MLHVGDITKLNGAELEPVDVICGGSPCQDLSVAGKRAGLAGERSGLFMEQIRIIKEMRAKDEASGRTGLNVRPRYAIWENVPGAYSSNDGKDFQAVLEEFVRVCEAEAPSVPMPKNGKWPTAGCLYDELGGWSIAWRTHDAQYWGVAQRRRRIALVADFGGLTAPEVLFESESVSGDSEPRGETRKRAAEGFEGSLDRPVTMQIRCGCDGGGKGPLMQTDKSATLSTVQSQTLFEAPCSWDGTQTSHTITVNSDNQRMPDKDNFTGVIQPTYAIEGNGSRESHKGDGYKESDTMYTLNTTEVHAVAYGIDQQGGKGMAGYGVEVCPTMASDSHGTPHAVAYGFDAYNQADTGEVSKPMTASASDSDHVPCVYGIGAYESNSWKSKNPNSGVYEADVSKTLDAINCGYPGCNQGGMAVVEKKLLTDEIVGTLCASGYPDKLTHQDVVQGKYPAVVEPILLESNQNHATVQTDGVSTTLPASMGLGGGYVPMVTEPTCYNGENITSPLNKTNPQPGDPCHNCDAYDEDLGCTMPSIDRSYACPRAAVGIDGYNMTTTGDKSATLGVNCGMSTGRNGVMVGNPVGGAAETWQERNTCVTLKATHYKMPPCVAGFKPQQGAKVMGMGYEEEIAPTPNTTMNAGVLDTRYGN